MVVQKYCLLRSSPCRPDDNNRLESSSKGLKQELDNKTKAATTTEQYLKERCHNLEMQLSEERKKNSATSMQKVKMMDYMQTFIQTIQPTPNVFMSTQLANLPMPGQSDLADIRRRMQENPNSIPSDTCLTVKVGIGGEPSISFDVEESRFRN